MSLRPRKKGSPKRVYSVLCNACKHSEYISTEHVPPSKKMLKTNISYEIDECRERKEFGSFCGYDSFSLVTEDFDTMEVISTNPIKYKSL